MRKNEKHLIEIILAVIKIVVKMKKITQIDKYFAIAELFFAKKISIIKYLKIAPFKSVFRLKGKISLATNSISYICVIMT